MWGAELGHLEPVLVLLQLLPECLSPPLLILWEKRKALSARGTNTAPGAACPKHFTCKKTLEILSFFSKERSCLSAAVKGAVSKLSHSHCWLLFPSNDASKSSEVSGEDEHEDLNPVLISFSTSRLSKVAALSISLCLSSRSCVLTCSTEQLGYKHQSWGLFLCNSTRLQGHGALQSEIPKPLACCSPGSNINFARGAPQMGAVNLNLPHSDLEGPSQMLSNCQQYSPLFLKGFKTIYKGVIEGLEGVRQGESLFNLKWVSKEEKAGPSWHWQVVKCLLSSSEHC